MPEVRTAQKSSIVEELTSVWPSLPFMAFGIWTAWSLLTYSGSLWLSENETNGEWLSNLFVVSTLAFATVFLAAAFMAQRRGAHVPLGNGAVLLGGLTACAGCVLIILAGPYYLGRFVDSTRALFWVGAVLSGVGTGVIGLRCGELYGMLPPRRALVYAALSQLVCAFIYFLVFAFPSWAPVEHGPTLVSILAFCLLPPIAAAVACIPIPKGSGASDEPLGFAADVRKLPGSFMRFVIFTFFVCLVMSAVRSAVVTTHALATTLEGNGVLMLLRVAMAIAFILYGVHSSAHGAGLGKICSLAAVFSAFAIAVAAALGGINNAWSVVIYFASSVFEFLMWCLLAFVVAQKRVAPVTVFGFGRGAFVVGSALGWLVGSYAIPLILQGPYATATYIVMAGSMLVLALGLFSERDFERLFSPVSEDELTLADLFGIEAREAMARDFDDGDAEEGMFQGDGPQGGASWTSGVQVSDDGDREGTDVAAEGGPHDGRIRKRGRFTRAIEKMTAEYGLSTRESDVLRCLAMGYGSERISETLGIKVNTVRAHTHNVYVKLEVHSREDLMLLVDDEVAAI